MHRSARFVRARSARTLPALALVAALVLSACGGSSHSKNVAATVTRTTQNTTTVNAADSAAATAANLRSRPTGELIVDGFSEGSLTQLAYQDYRDQAGTEDVSVENDSARSAFESFCTGSTDIVDSSSPISRRELALCHEDGITPVQIQVGSDAVVLATENETDVGADCLTDAQVKAIFRAGSPVENWDQLGFDDVPLVTAGPNPADANFAFFGNALVGATTPTLDDFRFDYRAYSDEDSIRRFVVGSQAAGELASAELPATLGEITNLDALITGWVDTVTGAKAYVKNATQKDDSVELAAATAKLDHAELELRILREERARDERRVADFRGAERRAESVLGHLGVFQFGYYNLYEEQLRPLEITAKATPENCIFPSQETITSGEYPLSRQLLLTVSLQELRQYSGLRAFLLSYLKNANQLANQNVLVPLPTNILVQEEDWLNGTKVPVAVTSGATNTGTANSISGDLPPEGESTATTGAGATPSAGSAGTSTTGGQVPQGVQ
jgi:ABC-type phosphate transport system substrate-binding protein